VSLWTEKCRQLLSLPHIPVPVFPGPPGRPWLWVGALVLAAVGNWMHCRKPEYKVYRYNCHAHTSPFRCTKSTARATSPTQRVRPPSFYHCRSVRLEQSSGPCLQSELDRSCFQAPDEDIFVRTVLEPQRNRARGRFAGDALYKSTHWQWQYIVVFIWSNDRKIRKKIQEETIATPTQARNNVITALWCYQPGLQQ